MRGAKSRVTASLHGEESAEKAPPFFALLRKVVPSRPTRLRPQGRPRKRGETSSLSWPWSAREHLSV